MPNTSTARVLRWKARQKRDEAVLMITVPRTATAHALIAEDLLHPNADDGSNEVLATAVQDAIHSLIRKHAQ